MNRDGFSFIPVGLKNKMRDIDSALDGTKRMVHPLSSCNYLKIEDTNMVAYEKTIQGKSERLVLIQEQQIDSKGYIYFTDVLTLNMSETHLRELIFIESVFNCRNSFHLIELIKLQPDMKVFFKSFMELEKCNLV